MAKQDNYKELLSKVGAFARDDEPYSEAGDQLSSAHLASWAFGDLRVLESTNKFQQDPDQGTLLDLLEAVRDSLGYQENLSKDLIRDRYKYDPEILFPEGRKKGLRSGKEQESASEPPKPPSGVLFVDKQSQKVLEEKVAQQHDQIEQLHDKIDQLLQAGQNEEVENKDNSEESETGNRGHTTSLMDTQPRPRPQVDASEDTKMREPPVNGAKPDTGMEEKDEPTSHPRWQVWKYLGF
jgi:hypothetical protein